MDADREKHLDRYKVLVGCSLSRSNQAKESGRVGRPASWGGATFAMHAWCGCMGRWMHGHKTLMETFYLVLPNACIMYIMQKIIVHHLLMDTCSEYTLT
jgi:hypothetical protein